VQDFALDPQLATDSLPVAELALSAARLMRDANYPWLLLVPRRPALVEIIDLDETDRQLLMREIARASQALRDTVACDKLNVAALGNSVRQLHVHVIARRRDDAAWPKPIWGAAPPLPYAAGEAEALAARLAARLK
jgi:diadenosine tetraphosphate (Ap4A) HIT family hydrolase